MSIKKYEGDKVDVTWDKRLCIHVGECGRADNELFESGRDPWCVPDLVDTDDVKEVVLRCPSGALAFVDHDGDEEVADEANVVVIANNGPLYVRGELNIDGAADDMDGVKFRAALCRCGLSKNKPFCDNAHEGSDFRDRGAVGKMDYEPLSEHDGELVINRASNGPLILEGNVRIMTAYGRVAWEGENCALCRCGESKNKPFCDGTHRKVGFEAD